MTNDKPQLLPCPFCGGEEAEVSYYAKASSPEPAGYFVECCSCSACGESFEIQGEAPDRADYTKSKAVAAWNHRISSQARPAEGLVRQVSRAIHEHLSRRDIMQYLDNDEDCEGLARAVLASLSAPTAERAQIVAWLRGQAAIYNDQSPDLSELPEWTLAQKWANALERGDHLASLTPSKDSDHE